MDLDTTGHKAPDTGEGAAPDSLSDQELNEALTPQEPQAEEGEVVTEEPVDGEPSPEAKLAKLQEENAALKKKTDHQELFLQRQATEVGELRKLKTKLLSIAEQKRKQSQEEMLVDPGKAMDTHAEAREAEEEAAGIDVQEVLLQNTTAIQQAFPDYEERISDIADTALEMGVPKGFIDKYRANPYGTPIGVLMPYMRAAALRKQLQEKTLENETLKKQIEGKPTLSKRIRETALKQPVVTAKGASSVKNTRINEETDISQLSDAELKELLETT